MRRIPLGVATALAIVLAGRAFAHEHMFIASTRPKGGALVLDYDFGRAFPLAELPNKPGTWIGVDPSFNSLVADDPGRSLYRLKNGARVTMEVTAVDPTASVELDGQVLKMPGMRAKVGAMPYLHVHPQWTLTLPAGTDGTATISFRVRASGYQPSPVYVGTLGAVATTTTTTTTLAGDTTTTTLAGPCTADSCNDGDSCTADTCDGTVCHHTPAVAAEAVLCRLQAFNAALGHIDARTKPARHALAKLYAALGKGQAAVQAARTAGTTKRYKRAERLVSKLTTTVDGVDRLSLFDTDAMAGLRDVASTAYDALTLWIQSSP